MKTKSRTFNYKEDIMDTFAEIAKGGIKGRLDQLYVPTPTAHEDILVSLLPNQSFEPLAGAKKAQTKAELLTELKTKRAEYEPFLQDLAPPLHETRKTLNLTTFTHIKIGSDEKQTVTLPHYGGPLGAQCCVYETTFNYTKPNENRVFIVFKGADYKAHVFVNGELAGTHEGFFAEFSFDITDLIKSGENTLKINLYNDYVMLGNVAETDTEKRYGDKIYAATGPGYDDALRGWHHCPPGMGLFDKVYLEEKAPVFVSSVFTRTLEEQVEVWCEVTGCDYTPQKIFLSVSLFGANHLQTCFENLIIEPSTDKEIGVGDTFTEVISRRENSLGAKLVLFCMKGRNLFKFSLPRKNLKTWQPETPFLYQLQISALNSDKQVLDNYSHRFGVRTFTQDVASSPKGMFYLNSEKIRLHGANTMGFEQQDVMRGDFNQLIDDILLAKLCNMNFLRLTQRPVQQEIYDYCDMLGLLTQTDFPLFGCLRRNQFAEAVRQAEEMERHVRAHACNVIISYINEPFPNANNMPNINMTRPELEQFFAAADIAVHLNNPDRVIKHVDGDYDPPSEKMPDNHCYPMWYNGHGIDIGRLHKGYWMHVKPDWYYGCGEFGCEGLEDESVMRKHYPKSWLPQTDNEQANWNSGYIVNSQTDNFYHFFYEKQYSLADWITESQRFQAFATRLMTEAFRRDYRMVTFAIHLFIDAFPSGWMKTIMDCERNPKPAYFAYKNALDPILVSLRTDKFSFFENETAQLEVWVCNDTAQSSDNCTMRLELMRQGKPFALASQPAQLVATHSGYSCTSKIDLPSLDKREVFTLRAMLMQNDNIIAENSLDIDVYPKADVTQPIIVRTPQTITTEDLEKVSQGAALFVHELCEGDCTIAKSTVHSKISGMAPMHFAARDTQHLWVAGFTPYDFRYFYDPKTDCIEPLAQCTFTSDDFTPVLASRNLDDNGKWAAAMLMGEKSYGNGKIIASQISYDLLMANPAGKTLLSRIK